MNAGEGFEVEAGEAPAAPRRVRRGGRVKRPRAARMRDATGEGRAERVLRWSIPVLYFLSFALTALAIYATCHEEFGELVRGPFWETFKAEDGGFAFFWRRNTLRMAALILLALAWLTALVTPASKGRGRWTLIWSALAATVFSTNREELPAVLLWVLLALAAGCVLYLVRNRQGSRGFALIVWVLILAELFMPLPFDENIDLGNSPDAPSYRALGPEIVTAHIEGPAFEYLRSDEPPSRLQQHWDFFLGALPPHLLFIGFMLLSLALLGVRGPVLGVVQVVVVVVGLAGTIWMLYTQGAEQGIIGFPEAPEHWAGLRLVGASLHGRLLCCLPALVAGIADLGTGDADRSSS
jgi:hypothetical protein